MFQNCDLLILIPGSKSVLEGSGIPSLLLLRGKKAPFLTGLQFQIICRGCGGGSVCIGEFRGRRVRGLFYFYLSVFLTAQGPGVFSVTPKPMRS